jgi:hypothetical protein
MIAPFVKRLFSGKIPLPRTIVQGFLDSEVFVHPGKDVKTLHEIDISEQIECQDKKEPGFREDKKRTMPLSRDDHHISSVSPIVIQSEGLGEERRKASFPETEVRFSHFRKPLT